MPTVGEEWENCGTPAGTAEGGPAVAGGPAAGPDTAGAVETTVAPGVAAAQREQHSMACHQRPSRSVTTARTAAPPHLQGWERVCRSGRIWAWQLSALHAQYAWARGGAAAFRWALRWATAAARPAAAVGRRCSGQAGRLHEMRTPVLPRPAGSRRTVHLRPRTRSSNSLAAACVIPLFLLCHVPAACAFPSLRAGRVRRAHRTRHAAPLAGKLALRPARSTMPSRKSRLSRHQCCCSAAPEYRPPRGQITGGATNPA